MSVKINATKWPRCAEYLSADPLILSTMVEGVS